MAVFPSYAGLAVLSGVGDRVLLECVSAHLPDVDRKLTHRRNFRSKGYKIWLKCSIWDTNLISFALMVVFPTSGVPLRSSDFDSTMSTMVFDRQPPGRDPHSRSSGHTRS